MSATGLDVFDTTLHKTNRWLKELAEGLGWDEKRDKPKAYLALRERHREDFLVRIDNAFTPADAIDAEQVARAVFALLARKVSEGEIEDVRHVLPSEIRKLWP